MDFEPERIPEREFKRRYAQEAIAVGLTKDQVVRVYALETGGDGTYDMQSGINPITKTGQADLLGARLRAAAARQHHRASWSSTASSSPNGCNVSWPVPATRPRIDALHRKIASLRRMIRSASSMPRRLVQACRLRADVEGPRHPRPQPRRRRRALAAVAEAARPQGHRRRRACEPAPARRSSS